MFDVFGSNVNPVVNYEGISKNVMDAGFQDDARWMYTAGEDGTVKIWDLGMRNLQCQRIYQAGASVNSVVLHPNQQHLILGDQAGHVHLWDLRTDKAEKYTPQTEASVQCVAVDLTGVLMAAITNKGVAHVYQLQQPQTKQIQLGDAEPNIDKGCYNHTPSAEYLKKLDAHKKYGLKIKFSPDSNLIATCSADSTAKIWKTDTLEQVGEFTSDGMRWVWDIEFSSDSQLLFTASSDNIGRLWNVETGEVKRKYIGHSKAITCLAFRDGQVDAVHGP